MDVLFRDLPRPSDVDDIRRLVEGTGFFRPDEVAVAAELVEERLAKGTDSGYYFWFADMDGRPAGYVCFGPTPCTIGSFDLYWIAVDRKRQSRGLGLRLCALAEESARAMSGRGMYVETSGKEQYLPTQRFYEKAGYRKAAELPDFYDVGDAKIIYSKKLLSDTGA